MFDNKCFVITSNNNSVAKEVIMRTEAAKMGRELEESVMEILARVKEYRGKYQ